MEKVIITFGKYDLLHSGHKNLLKRAKEEGCKLIVGIYSDWLILTQTGLSSIQDEKIRMKNVKELEYVDEVFLQESLEDKALHIKNHNASLLVMGWDEDWSEILKNCPCDVKFFQKTPDISSTQIKKKFFPKRDSYISKMVHLPGTYKHPDTPSNEIFPLKKYDFYGYEIYGPKNYNTMKNYYEHNFTGNESMMTHSKVKWQKKVKNIDYRGVFKLENFEPAKFIPGNYCGTKKCHRGTTACLYIKGPDALMETENGPEVRPCCRHRLNNMLLDVITLLKEKKIPYFVYWGTLLGILRHKGSIPWDTDHDLYILDSFKEKFVKLVVPILQRKWYISIVDDGFHRVNVSKVNRAHIDVMFAKQIKN